MHRETGKHRIQKCVQHPEALESPGEKRKMSSVVYLGGFGCRHKTTWVQVLGFPFCEKETVRFG